MLDKAPPPHPSLSCRFQSLRGKYLGLIYGDQMADAAQTAYVSSFLDPLNVGERNGGAHFHYLARLLTRAGGG